MSFLKFIFKYIPKYKWFLLLYILFTILGSIFSVFSFTAIIPILNVLFGVKDINIDPVILSEVTTLRDYINGLISNILHLLQGKIGTRGQEYVLILSCVFLILMTIVKNILTYTSNFFRAPIRHGILRDMRFDLYSKIIKLPVDYFAHHYKGDVLSRITSDIIEVASGIKKVFNLLIRDAIQIIISILTLFAISTKLTFMAILSIPFYVIFFNVISKLVQRLTLQAQNLMGYNVSHFDEMMSGLRTIKSFGMEEKLKDIYNRQNDITAKRYIVRNRIADLAYPLSDIIITIIAAIILLIGGEMILIGTANMSGSVFIYFLVVFFSILSPIMSATDSFFGIRQSMACVERLNSVLRFESFIEQETGQEREGKNISNVQYQNVSFGYSNNTLVLKDISVNLTKGNIYAIIGKSGVGKTTFVDLLFRFYDATEGRILLNNKDIKQWDISELRKSISYVNQDAFLFNDSILNNIKFGNEEVCDKDVIDLSKKLGIHNLITSMPEGYNTIVGDQGSKLSGGQKQYICLVRALLKKSSVLVLDEATSALDQESEINILNALKDILSDKIVIIITHNSAVCKYSEHTYHIIDGQIALK